MKDPAEAVLVAPHKLDTELDRTGGGGAAALGYCGGGMLCGNPGCAYGGDGGIIPWCCCCKGGAAPGLRWCIVGWLRGPRSSALLVIRRCSTVLLLPMVLMKLIRRSTTVLLLIRIVLMLMKPLRRQNVCRRSTTLLLVAIVRRWTGMGTVLLLLHLPRRSCLSPAKTATAILVATFLFVAFGHLLLFVVGKVHFLGILNLFVVQVGSVAAPPAVAVNGGRIEKGSARAVVVLEKVNR